MIEQVRMKALEALVAESQFASLSAAVDDQFGTRGNTGVDVAAHPIEGGLGDQRSVVGLGGPCCARPAARPVRPAG